MEEMRLNGMKPEAFDHPEMFEVSGYQDGPAQRRNSLSQARRSRRSYTFPLGAWWASSPAVERTMLFWRDNSLQGKGRGSSERFNVSRRSSRSSTSSSQNLGIASFAIGLRAPERNYITSRRFLLCLFLFLGFLTAVTSPAYADEPPRKLLYASDIEYLGSFRVPLDRYGPAALARFGYGGTAPAFNPNNNSLFMVGHSDGQLVAEITIPELTARDTVSGLSRATFLQKFADATDGLMGALAVTEGQIRMGGLLVNEGNLYGRRL